MGLSPTPSQTRASRCVADCGAWVGGRHTNKGRNDTVRGRGACFSGANEQGDVMLKWWIAIFFLTFSSQTFAGPNECKTAIERYNTAVEEVPSTLRRYTRCISYSEGRDDCSREFSRIRAAHNEFGSAVADYERECT